MKRINPATGKPFRRGDVREDGYTFFTYVKTCKTKAGFFKEKWLSPAAAARQETCQQESIKRWQSQTTKRRRLLLDQIKMTSGCMSCGYNQHPAALDFDHIEPSSKLFTIGTAYGTCSIKRLYEEVAKCRVLCANCHRIKTVADQAANAKLEG